MEPSTRRPGLARAVPGSAFTPFEVFPSLAAVPHHYGRCPLDVRTFSAPADHLAVIAALAESGPTDASQIRRPAPACRRTVAAPSLEPLGPGPSTVWTCAVASARLPRSHVAHTPLGRSAAFRRRPPRAADLAARISMRARRLFRRTQTVDGPDACSPRCLKTVAALAPTVSGSPPPLP